MMHKKQGWEPWYLAKAQGLGNSLLWVGVQGPGLPGPLHGVGPQKGGHTTYESSLKRDRDVDDT